MAEPPLLIHHHQLRTGGASVAAVARDNYAADEVVDLDEASRVDRIEASRAGRSFDPATWYREWHDELSDEERQRIKCVMSHDANFLAPELQGPWRAFCLLRDPVERVSSLFHLWREATPGPGAELQRRGWDLADIYRELGGGAPSSSELHESFRDFFNGQARGVVAPWQDAAKLGYWAGLPESAVEMRNQALDLLTRHYVVGVQEQLNRSIERLAAAFDWERLWVPQLNTACRRKEPDAETRALILAHNQVDAELHAHFSAAVARGRRPRRVRRASDGAAVCVLGMSRSGTSVTARILHVLGVDLGPEAELLPAAAGNNPTGFWEHKGIADLNEDILATLGEAPRQRWRFPPALLEGWEHDPRLERHRATAASLLRQSFSLKPLWGWKDPRTCLTLPFWSAVLSRLRNVESRLRFVVCIRNPLDVAASLADRDDLEREEALALWRRYMSQAVLHTNGYPRVFVSYESYFTDWEAEATRLAGFIGLETLSAVQRTEIAAHLDEGLWHHRRGKRTAFEKESLPADVGDLYTRLMALCRAEAETSVEIEAEP
jgi:hypothetical protein